MAPTVLLKGFKQSVMLRAFGKKIPLFESSQIWLVGYLLGSVSPGRSGDFLRAVYFKKNFSVNLGNGLSLILLDRAMDVTFLLLAGLFGLLFFSFAFNLGLAPILLVSIFLAVFLAGLFLLTKKRFTGFIMKPIFNFLVPKKFKEALKSGFGDFYLGLACFRKNKKILFFAVFLTLASWLLFFFQVFILSLALGLSIPLDFIFLMMPIATLVEILPISFSGMGTRDATLIFFLGFLQISGESAVSLSILILSSQLLIALAGAFFLKKTKNLEQKAL
ncbi:MAG: flippase-like domain-containing protein, partial [Candidatus Diapherotrites archaeon]|nr:flippase-like domain-containing protein [Candidatus Diapherotrites archaeon]